MEVTFAGWAPVVYMSSSQLETNAYDSCREEYGIQFFFVFDLMSTRKDPLSALNNHKFQRYFGTKGTQNSQIIESY